VKNSVLGLVAFANVLLLTPAAYSDSFDFGYIDKQLNGTSQIAYDLALSGAACPPDCTMIVTIKVSGTPSPNITPVYLGSLVFKFGGSSPLDLDSVGGDTLPTAIPAGWAVLKDADVDNRSSSNLHSGSVPNGGFVGFYNANLASNLISLSTAGTYTLMFDAHGVKTSSNPSLHNEYYTLNGRAVNFDTFLSVTASEQVPLMPTPEPTTIVLALTALGGVGIWMRKRHR
jgi:PEP-CTERM motif